MIVRRFNLQAEDAAVAPRIEAALLRVARSGAYIGGDDVEGFRGDVARYLEVPPERIVTCASGTDALTLGALGMRPDVPLPVAVVPAMTFSATADALARAGYRVLLADVNQDVQLTPDAVAKALTRGGVADDSAIVVPVHFHGLPLDREAWGCVPWAVLADGAQAFGGHDGRSCVGAHSGHATAFSCFPTKPLGAYGDAGFLVALDPEMGVRCRGLAHHGFLSEKFVSEAVGFNSRLDAMQAAVLRIKLEQVGRLRRRRAEVAQQYRASLGEDLFRLPRWDEGHAWHSFVLRMRDVAHRDPIREHLRAAGVETTVPYPYALHEQPAWAAPRGAFPEAELAARDMVGIPCWAMPDDQVAHVVEAVTSFSP